MIIGARGCVYRVAMPGGGQGSGFYRLDPDLGTGRGDYPILLTAVTGTKSDNLGLFPCLENFKVIYTFGQGFGDTTISGVVFLGRADETNVSQSMAQLQRYFDRHRASVWKRPISVSMGSLKVAQRVYLRQLRMGAPDTELHVQPFEMSGVLVEAL